MHTHDTRHRVNEWATKSAAYCFQITHPERPTTYLASATLTERVPARTHHPIQLERATDRLLLSLSLRACVCVRVCVCADAYVLRRRRAIQLEWLKSLHRVRAWRGRDLFTLDSC
jgi:hypothetical protein